MHMFGLQKLDSGRGASKDSLKITKKGHKNESADLCHRKTDVFMTDTKRE